MGRHSVLLVLLLCYNILFIGRVRCSRNVSSKEDVNKEIHLQLLNKPSIKTIQVGTIPTQRISKKDFTGESQTIETKEMETTNRPITYLAIARTRIGPSKYSGVGGYIKLDNPKVTGQQFSATRIKLQAGFDSIEAGWRVDPSLYGDSRTRLYIRTDAGETQCFNTDCSGFIQTHLSYALNFPFDNISIPGGPLHYLQIYIERDNRNGNWNLLMGEGSILIGYWPSHIFTELAGFADRAELGGAAYSPLRTPLPSLGSGNHPIGDPLRDGTIYRIKVLNERGQRVDTSDLETYADNSKLYSILDDGYRGRGWGHVIFYGGSGH